MATVTFEGSTWTTQAGNKSVTMTPAVGDLLLVICGNSGRTTAQPPTVTCDVQGITFTQFTGTNGSYTKNTSADSGWVFISDSLCTAASSTIVTMNQSGDSGGGLAVWAVTGMSIAGEAAIRQCGKQDNQASGTPAPAFGVAALTTNPVFGWVHTGTNGSANSAIPSGWAAEDADSGYNTPPNGRQCCHRNSGETNTTITFGAVAPSAFGAIVVELDASAPTPNFDLPILTTQLVAH